VKTEEMIALLSRIDERTEQIRKDIESLRERLGHYEETCRRYRLAYDRKLSAWRTAALLALGAALGAGVLNVSLLKGVVF
jgi:hypothetical protein